MNYLEFLCRHHTKIHRMSIPSFQRQEGPIHIHLIRVFSGRALTLTRPIGLPPHAYLTKIGTFFINKHEVIKGWLV